MSGPSQLTRTSNVTSVKSNEPSKDESEEREFCPFSFFSKHFELESIDSDPGSSCEQDTIEGTPASNLSVQQSVKQCNNSEISGYENLASEEGETVEKPSEREMIHRMDTDELPEAQVQEHNQKDSDKLDDDIPLSENNSVASDQNKTNISQEAADHNNSTNSEIDHDGANRCSPAGDICGEQQKDNQSGEQPTQDSDLSPSHSSISAKTNNDQDEVNKEHEQQNSSTLGRNRRVRQKNRYFADFHCMQLVKGCRSRDDYDAYSPSTSATRSSNRRSTTDSARNSPGATNQPSGKPIFLKDLFTNKYCRKCGDVKPHDEHNKCQICLYDEIISAEKRRKASLRSSSKTKPKTKSSGHKTPTKEEHPPVQSQAPDEVSQKLSESTPVLNHVKFHEAHQPTVSSITIKQEQTNKGQTTESQKRKWVVKPGKSLNDDNVISICREIDSSNQNSEQYETNDEPKRKVIIKTAGEQLAADKMMDDGSTRGSSSSDSTSTPSSKSIDSNANNNSGDNDIDNQANHLANIKPDMWTPEQVAQFVSSKGFVSESDLFREQDVDGISLLMMKRQDITYGLKMKLGPALKLYEQIRRLRRDYDQEAAIAS